MRSYSVKENQIGLAVSEILRYTHTQTNRHPVTLVQGQTLNFFYIYVIQTNILTYIELVECIFTKKKTTLGVQEKRQFSSPKTDALWRQKGLPTAAAVSRDQWRQQYHQSTADLSVYHLRVRHLRLFELRIFQFCQNYWRIFLLLFCQLIVHLLRVA